jgi:spermidine/putrescine transport system permease protein
MLARVPRRFRGSPAYPLLLPGVAWLAIFFLLPMYFLLEMSLREGNLQDGFTFTWHFSTYTDALSTYHSQFVRSVLYAGAATTAAFVISYPLAYFIAFRGGRYKNLLLLLVIAPFFTNYLIRTLAWETILADRGIVTQTLDNLGILSLLEHLGWTSGGRLLATPAAVVAGITYNYLPFMTLPLYVSLEKIDKRLLEAALDLYADRVRAFLRVTLPLSLPGVFAGTLLTFVPALGDYINAELLGSTDTRMIGNVIQAKYLIFNDYPSAAALSFVLLAGILVFIIVYAKILGTEELSG